MSSIADISAVPVSFKDLPVLAGPEYRHAWHIYGPDDQLGTLNRLTEVAVARAAGTVRAGERIPLTLPVDQPEPPLFGRERLQHTIFAADRNTWDDRIDSFYPQASTQWDGLRHVRAREHGFYGGWQGDPDGESDHLGIHHWAKQGIVGRGVLIDLPASEEFDPFDGRVIEVADLERALHRQNSALSHGDILCIRFGWMDRYLGLDDEGRQAISDRFESAAQRSWAGLSASAEMSEFLWDSGVAALACDNPAVEVTPGDPAVGSLHRRLIPCLGFAIGELFDFGPLAAACQRHARQEFMFVSVPLSITGGVGSPGNAIAIF